MKYEYLIEEKLTYVKRMVVETDMGEDELIDHMERAERLADTAEDVAFNMDDVDGIKVSQYPDSDYSSPTNVEIEYYDHRKIDK